MSVTPTHEVYLQIHGKLGTNPRLYSFLAPGLHIIALLIYALPAIRLYLRLCDNYMAALPYNAEHYQPPLAAGCGLTWARRQWILESQVGLPVKKSMEKMEAEHLIEEVGAQLRSMMPWLQKK